MVPVMFRIPAHQRRRWSLSLIALLLLHWTFGICSAVADVLCLGVDGTVVLERQGQPCHDAVAAKQTGKNCIDLKAGEHGDSHDSLPSSAQLADLPPVYLAPAFGYELPEPIETALTLSLATGPPLPSRSVVLRETTVLLI